MNTKAHEKIFSKSLARALRNFDADAGSLSKHGKAAEVALKSAKTAPQEAQNSSQEGIGREKHATISISMPEEMFLKLRETKRHNQDTKRGPRSISALIQDALATNGY